MLRSLALVSTVIIMLATASTAGAEPPQPLGGLDLGAYCRAEGFDWVIFPRGQLAHHAAVQNWRCATSEGDSQPINMSKACTWTYGKTTQARFYDLHNAYTWVCYSGGSE
jgi:hypothetical protein